jgi:hypothetical protein
LTNTTSAEIIPKKTSIKKNNNNNNFPSDCGIPLALSWNLSHGKSIENIGARSKFITEKSAENTGVKTAK